MMTIEKDFHNGVKDVLKKWAFEQASPENMQAIFNELKVVVKKANDEVSKTKEDVKFSVIDVVTKDNDVHVTTYIQFKDGGKSFGYTITGKIDGEIYEKRDNEEVPF